MRITSKIINNAFFGIINLIFFIPSNPSYSEVTNLNLTEPVTIAVRKFKNFAGDFAENGVVEGINGEKIRVGFWKPSFEIKLAEVLTNELANTGHFTVVERNNLYEIFEEQAISGTKKNLTKAKYIVIASLSDYVAVDVRVINTSTGAIAYSRTIEGTTSSVSKADRSGLALGFIDSTSEKKSYETTSATRALRAALIKVVDYLDCQLYLQDECIAEFEAEDEKRKNSTEGTLNLF